MKMKNTLAYDSEELITALKKLYGTGPGFHKLKIFTLASTQTASYKTFLCH
jgi:hypothetical protein